MRQGKVPAAFVRRMRTINMLSATTLMKIEDDFLLPFDVMDVHHILDVLISQDAIIDQLDSDELSYALTTGNIRPLQEIAGANPLLMKGLTSGWMNLFINEPFDPLCVMLAMRAKAMLDLVDEEGKSYNLIRKLGFGFIDFGEIEGEEPGDPGDYYPPAIDNPIGLPEAPGPAPPGPDDPGYTPPAPMPGEPGGGDGGGTGGSGGGSAPWGFGSGAGDLGGAVSGSSTTPPVGGDPCADVDNPEETVSFSYTTQQMAVSETQDFAVTGMHPRWSYENYTWKISGGGGSIYSTGGDPEDAIGGPTEEGYDEDAHVAAFGVTYTAPAANADCLNNPTIELWCGGALMASLTIAVNAVEGGIWKVNYYYDAEIIPTAFDECTQTTGTCVGCYISHVKRAKYSRIKCDGSNFVEEGHFYVVGSTGTCNAPWQCEYCAVGETCPGSCEGKCPYPTDEEIIENAVANCGEVDLRTEGDLAAGCCPEQLL